MQDTLMDDSEKTISKHARVLNDELTELQLRIKRSRFGSLAT